MSDDNAGRAMSKAAQGDGFAYRVVISDEERYSIWPTYKDIPYGWRDGGYSGPKQACLDYISEVWVDMRPYSLRRVLDASGRSVQLAPVEERDPWLDLLLPRKLAAEVPVDAAESERLHRILSSLRHALELDDGARLARLDALLGELSKPRDAQAADINTSGVSLTPFQARDYDRYFRVNRWETGAPATLMVLGLVQTAHGVLHLLGRSKGLPAIHVRRQIDGFITHTHLLARSFGLDPLQ